MERERKKSFEKALEGKSEQPAGRGSEIEALEQQINSGTCSAAAAVGLKKRLAALKAQALREQRAAEQRARAAAAAAQAPPPPPQQQQQHQQLPPLRTPSPDFDDDGYLPPPAVPPPRPSSRAGHQSPAAAAAAAAAEWNRTLPKQGSPCGMDLVESPLGFDGHPGRRRSSVSVGAAAAPWGNAFSDA